VVLVPRRSPHPGVAFAWALPVQHPQIIAVVVVTSATLASLPAQAEEPPLFLTEEVLPQHETLPTHFVYFDPGGKVLEVFRDEHLGVVQCREYHDGWQCTCIALWTGLGAAAGYLGGALACAGGEAATVGAATPGCVYGVPAAGTGGAILGSFVGNYFCAPSHPAIGQNSAPTGTDIANDSAGKPVAPDNLAPVYGSVQSTEGRPSDDSPNASYDEPNSSEDPGGEGGGG
jgi:hypothetical protein